MAQIYVTSLTARCTLQEVDLFVLVVGWCAHDHQHRTRHLDELLRCVHPQGELEHLQHLARRAPAVRQAARWMQFDPTMADRKHESTSQAAGSLHYEASAHLYANTRTCQLTLLVCGLALRARSIVACA